MRYGSVCSGIEAATVAWHPLNWTAAWFAEIDPFACAVLAHHYPGVPNLGDMTRLGRDGQDIPAIDLLVGGTPCQSFSVAGLRKGLADPRGNLALEYLRVLDATRARWCVWENVPGVLSSSGGRDFGAFLGGLAELGYGFAYRVLDAQFAGVPQRRRRVFVVGHLGDWRRAAAVLFERHSLSGHPPPRREAGQGTAGRLKGCAGNNGSPERGDLDLVAYRKATRPHGPDDAERWEEDELAGTLNGWEERHDPPPYLVAHTLRADGFDAGEDGTGRGVPLIPVVAPCLTQNYGKQPDNSDTSAGPMLVPVSFDSTWSGDYGIEEGDVSVPLKDGHGTVPAVAYGLRPDAGRDGEARTPSPDAAGRVRLRDPGFNVYEEMAPTLEATAPHSVAQAMVVRRLTPVECARLQGFPDDYLTQVPYRGKPAADGNQYKALGNSFAVPVVRWIGQRIALVDAVARDEGALEVAS